MSYLVFARKYRPQTFEDVVQQHHVTQTLTNAIRAGRLAHAILFSGPRGTGKTTIARILAKAMNCAQGPTQTPCNKCQSCLEITAGNAADVFEIDGASNNSVDQVRELRDNLRYMPVHSRHKIYIIDEVHMLSLAAFNALLKTLEEPPGHILFMFATTEPHKIPITILSRCQRHDLRRVDTSAIRDHLAYICKKEEVAVDTESLALIAQEAGGSIRDSLSLLDHVLSCAQGPVTVQLISELLGIVDREHLFSISEAVFNHDLALVLEKIDAVWRQGYDIKRFYADLVAHFHHLTVIKLGTRAIQLVDLPGNEIERMKEQAANVEDMYLTYIFDFLFQAETSIKFSSQPKYALEMFFLKLFQVPPSLPIDTLITRLDQLKINLPQVGLNQAGDMGAPQPSSMVVLTDTSVGEKDYGDKKESDSPSLWSSEVVTCSSQITQLPQTLTGQALWLKLLERVAEQKPSLSAILKKCELKDASDQQLAFEVPGTEFTYHSVIKHLSFLEDLCRELSGRNIKLKINANIEDTKSKQHEKQKAEQVKQKALGHPMVMAAVELFDGKIIDIKIP